MTDDVVVPFDKARKRRFTKGTAAKDAEFEMVSFRAPNTELRRVEEIVAARVDPDLKTRSDVLCDALHSWLDNFFKEHGDEIPSVKDRFVLEHINWIKNSRSADLTFIRSSLKEAVEESNRPLLGVVLFNIMRFQTDVQNDPYGSPTQRSEIQELSDQTKKAIERLDKQ